MVAEFSDIDGTVTRRRRFVYVALFVTLFFAYFYLRDSSWRGDISLHTLMETVSTVLALAVGSLALVRYYSKKDNTFLFIGTGFVATAFLDGYHTVVSSSHFIETFPSTPPSLIAWSWFASRTFLSLLLWMSWLFWRHGDRRDATGLISEKLVYGTVTTLALVCFAIVAFVPMPAAYYQQLPVPRPQEFLPALFFLLALIGYLRKGKWKTDVFEHWLVLSLIVSFMGQAMFMSFSGQVFDMMFDSAHLLKNASYICAMLGPAVQHAASVQRIVRAAGTPAQKHHTGNTAGSFAGRDTCGRRAQKNHLLQPKLRRVMGPDARAGGSARRRGRVALGRFTAAGS